MKQEPVAGEMWRHPEKPYGARRKRSLPPSGYTPSHSTDIGKTFAKVRKTMKEQV